MQDGDLALGAVDGVVNEIELDFQLRALLDLGAVGFQQRVGIGGLARDIRGDSRTVAGVAEARHLCADRAQLGHDLTMHRTDLAAFDGRHDNWRVAQKGLFNTKTFAIDRHEFFPPLHFRVCSKPMRFNVRFTPEHVVTAVCPRPHTND